MPEDDTTSASQTQQTPAERNHLIAEAITGYAERQERAARLGRVARAYETLLDALHDLEAGDIDLAPANDEQEQWPASLRLDTLIVGVNSARSEFQNAAAAARALYQRVLHDMRQIISRHQSDA